MNYYDYQRSLLLVTIRRCRVLRMFTNINLQQSEEILVSLYEEKTLVRFLYSYKFSLIAQFSIVFQQCSDILSKIYLVNLINFFLIWYILVYNKYIYIKAENNESRQRMTIYLSVIKF